MNDTAWSERIAVTNTLIDIRAKIEKIVVFARKLPACEQLPDYGDGMEHGLMAVHALVDVTIKGFAEEDKR